MNNLRWSTGASIFAVAFLCTSLLGGVARGAASTAGELNKEGEQALHNLYKSNPIASDISKKARAILVFPNVVKAGFVFGGAYGEGVLFKDAAANSYYNSVSASFGLQAGAQSYGYVIFLMNGEAISYLDKSDGWELGVGPTLVVVNEGVAKNLSTSTLQDDAYAFVFDQQGLMASLSLEGTKVSRIKR
jgi:lipid-binding SYLF domain-containing protein